MFVIYMKSGKIIGVLFKITIVVLLFFMAKYVYTLYNENCECAINGRDLTFIKYYIYIIFVLNTLLLLITNKQLTKIFSRKNTKLIALILPFLLIIAGIIYVISVFKYLVRTKDCLCSKSWEKLLLRIHAIILSVIFSIFALTLIIMFLTWNIKKFKI